PASGGALKAKGAPGRYIPGLMHCGQLLFLRSTPPSPRHVSSTIFFASGNPAWAYPPHSKRHCQGSGDERAASFFAPFSPTRTLYRKPHRALNLSTEGEEPADFFLIVQ